MSFFSKDGLGTQFVELLPFGGSVTAPIHAIAGNHEHAALATAGAVVGALLPGVGGAAFKGTIAGAKVAVKAAVKVGAKAAIKASAKAAAKKTAANIGRRAVIREVVGDKIKKALAS